MSEIPQKYQQEFDEATAELLSAFETSMYRTKNENTAQTWVSATVTFARWFVNRYNKAIDTAERADVDTYFEYVVDEFAPPTQGGKIDGVMEFYNWLERKQKGKNVAAVLDRSDYISKSGTRQADILHQEDDYIAIPRETVEQLWAEDHVPAPRVRNELIIKLLWYTGIRCSELVELRLQAPGEQSPLDRDEGKFIVYAPKTNDYRTVYYPKNRLELLFAEWLDLDGRSALSPHADSSPYLFLTHQSEQMRPSHVSRIVKKAAQRGGVNEVLYTDANGKDRWKITGHTLRHSMASYHANVLNTPITVLQDLLGHEKLETTRKYVSEDEEAKKRALQDPW